MPKDPAKNTDQVPDPVTDPAVFPSNQGHRQVKVPKQPGTMPTAPSFEGDVETDDSGRVLINEERARVGDERKDEPL